MRRTLLPMTVLFLLLAALQAPAATWYVDRTATGTGTGTSWTEAWKSFSAIRWSSVRPGDTIYISGGTTSKTYSETLSIGASGTASNPIVIRPGQASGHNGTVTITSGGNGISTNDHDYITVNGEVQGQRRIRLLNNKSHGIYTGTGDDFGLTFTWLAIEGNGTSGHHGIQVRGRADNLVISHCIIRNNFQDGINLYLGTSGTRYDQAVIHHNEISGSSSRGDDGIQAGGGGGLTIYNNSIHTLKSWTAGHPDGIQTHMGANYLKIYNNIFYDIANSGMFIDPTKAGTHAHIRIYNNLIYQTDNSLSSMRGIQIYAAAASGTVTFDDIVVANNTFADIRLWGLYFKERSSCTGRLRNAVIANNLTYNCYTGNATGAAVAVALRYSPSADNVQFKNNLVHKGGSGTGRVQWAGGNYTTAAALNAAGGATGNIMDAPSFVSYAANRSGNDFRLKAGSAGVDAGCVLTSFATDCDGVPRPQGGGWDIGISEAGGAAAPRAPTGLRIVQ